MKRYTHVLVAGLFAVNAVSALGESVGSYKKDVKGFYGSSMFSKKGHFDESAVVDACYSGGPGKLFRSGQPLLSFDPSKADTTQAALDTIRANNITLVVNLRTEAESQRRDEKAILEKTGVRMIHYPMFTSWSGGADAYTDEQIAQAIATLDEIYQALGRGENVLVHCMHGEDRTGIMVALLRQWDGSACPTWRKEFDTYGGTMYKPLQTLYDVVLRKHRLGG